MAYPNVRERVAIIAHYNQTCTYCGRRSDSPKIGPDGRAWELDHVMPRRAGGHDGIDNLALSCFTCNHRKSGALPGADWQHKPEKVYIPATSGRGRKPLSIQDRKLMLRCVIPPHVMADLEADRQNGEPIGIVLERWWVAQGGRA